MAGSKLQKKIFNYAYGIGAAVVIVGALAKILHADIFGISGSVLLRQSYSLCRLLNLSKKKSTGLWFTQN